MRNIDMGVAGLLRVVRARYEGGVLKLLDRIDLRDGEEVVVWVEKPEERERVIDEFKGFLGGISEKELEELIGEAELEKL
ncbi:MAG: antitoxin family protein [Desulfurococcales archaeon]|nr:antitoxin family protein [Desulfurococcales archaeon]